jgi:hypothetical protein
MNSVGHPFGPGPTATIREDSERVDTWRTIFGGLTAPIKTAVPFACMLPGVGRALVYDIDTARLDEASLDRLIDFARATFAPDRDRAEVHEDIVRRFGFPIHADDVSTVTNEHPEALIAGLDAEIAKAKENLRKSVGEPDIRARLDMRPTLELDQLMEPLRRKAEEDAARGQSDDAFYETPQHIRHAALDAVFGGIADRMDVQAGFAATPKVQTVDKPYTRPRLILTVAGAPPNSTLAAIIGQHVGSHAFSPMIVNGPNGPEPKDFADDVIYESDLPETYAIPEGARIGDVSIPAGNLTAQQVADLIGGTMVRPGTILSPPLAMHSAKSRIIFDEQDILSELSDSDGLPPALCSCLTGGTPLGPHCVHSRVWTTPTMQRVRKHGGAHMCPRKCGECADGAHHFCEVDMQPVFALDMSDDEFAALDEDAQEEVIALRAHPAALAGCDSWYECRHCDAWIEASDDDMSDDEEDNAPDGHCDDCGEHVDECECDDDDDWCDGCNNDIDECECDDDEPDSEPLSDGVPLSVAMRGALIEPPTNDERLVYPDVIDAGLEVHPPDILSLAESAILTCRFIGLLTPAQAADRTLFAHWSGVAAQWPADVRTDVLMWTERTAPNGDELDVPNAVRTLVEQANGGKS